MDARALGFSEHFDVVFSNAALHWVRDHRHVLAQIRRSLRPGGRVFLQMGGQGNAAALIQVFEALRRESPWELFFEGFRFPYGFHHPTHYRAWLHQVGLTPRRIELIPKDMIHENPHIFRLWIQAAWHPYTQRVPKGLQNAFIREVVQRYLRDHPPDSQGRVHIHMVRLEVEASRENEKNL